MAQAVGQSCQIVVVVVVVAAGIVLVQGFNFGIIVAIILERNETQLHVVAITQYCLCVRMQVRQAHIIIEARLL